MAIKIVAHKPGKEYHKLEKLIILGFSPAYLPIITERTEEIFGCKTFDVVHNIDRKDPDYTYQDEDYTIRHFRDEEYDFESNKDIPVFFGCLHSHIKYILFHFFKKHYGVGKERYLNLVDNLSFVSKTTKYQSGFSTSPMTSIFPFCNIGFGVNIKRNSTLGEHSVIGDYVSINPGVSLSGFVTVGEGTEISTGATSVHDVKIGKHCLIGAGSVITKNIPDGVIAYGNPCRVIRKNDRWKKLKT